MVPIRFRGKGVLEVKSQSDGEVEILVYDVIGQDMFGEGVSAQSVVRQLQGIDASKINVRINSIGGEAFDGFAIYNALRRHPAEVVTHIDGIAASAAATVAMAGNRIKMSENAFLMIHKSWGVAIGNSDELIKFSAELDHLDGSIARTYANRTGKSENRVMELMAEETWFNSGEAKSHRFIDEITDKGKTGPVIENRFDLSKFKNVPASITPFSGARLASLLNRLIDEQTTDDRTRADIIEDIGRAAGISASTVNQILNDEITCPPISRLDGFAEVLDVSVRVLVAAAERDGCQYESESSGPCKGKTLSAEFDSLEAALTAVEGFSARVQSLTDLRKGQDRTPLSNENRGRLEDVQAKLNAIQAGMQILLAQNITADDEVAANLLAQLVCTEVEIRQLTMEG